MNDIDELIERARAEEINRSDTLLTELITALQEMQQRIEELEKDNYSTDEMLKLYRKIKRLEAALKYIGDPQNGMVDLAAYARKAIE